MRIIYSVILIFCISCSPISRKSLEKPKLQNGFEYYSASVDSMNAGANSAALALVKDAIKLNPNYAKFYLLEGDVYHKLNDLEAALNSYNHAIQLRSSSIEALLRIANIYESDYKNYDEAIKFYRRAYAVNNSIYTILIDIGECYLAKNEILLAKNKAEEYKNIIEAKNQLPSFDYFYLNGKINFRQQKYEKAKIDFEQAIKIKPKDFNAKLLLVKSLFELSEQEAGLQYINQLMRLNDKVGELYYYRAVYYFTKTKYKDALGLFEQALSLDNTLLKSHYYLGKIYESLGDMEKSLKHLQMYRKTMEIN